MRGEAKFIDTSGSHNISKVEDPAFGPKTNLVQTSNCHQAIDFESCDVNWAFIFNHSWLHSPACKTHPSSSLSFVHVPPQPTPRPPTVRYTSLQQCAIPLECCSPYTEGGIWTLRWLNDQLQDARLSTLFTWLDAHWQTVERILHLPPSLPDFRGALGKKKIGR